MSTHDDRTRPAKGKVQVDDMAPDFTLPAQTSTPVSLGDFLGKTHVVTTNYIIAELVPLLTSRSRISRQQIFAFVDTLRVSPHIEIIHVDVGLDAQAWELLKARIDKAWSLVDASNFVIMKIHGMIEALTTDHHFTQAGFVRLPTEVI